MEVQCNSWEAAEHSTEWESFRKTCCWFESVLQHRISLLIIGYITIKILDIILNPVFYLKTQRFGNCILSPSSGGTYSIGHSR
jgi:hypothetical protein